MTLFPEMHFAPGIDMRDMTPQTLYAWVCASVACWEFGTACVATSIKRPGSLHSKGQAIDIGMRDVSLAKGDAIHEKLDKWIGRAGGGQYDVVNELRPGSSPNWTGPHIHIEFDPK